MRRVGLAASVFGMAIMLFAGTVCASSGTQSAPERVEIEYAREFAPERVEIEYAHEFALEAGEDGSFDVTIGEEHYHVDRPYSRIYLAASSAMDLFLKGGGIEAVASTGTKEADWGIEEIRELIGSGKIQYAGKYSAPDYEYLTASGCDLAIESTMIYHTPEVKEKLEALGIPVLVERSSYETDPLGRMEWIKLYGALTGHYAEAAAFFDSRMQELKALEGFENTGKKVAFFYINSSGQPVVRKPGDYVSRMIAMAGGAYFLETADGEDNMLSTMNMEMEAFVEAAGDADILIYNSSISGELYRMDELTGMNGIFGRFKAVRNGDVWCTGKNMFQESSAVADMILEMHEIICGSAGDGSGLGYFHRLT